MTKYSERAIINLMEDEDVKFIRLQFVDLFGELKNIAITSNQMTRALAGKCKVDGFHVTGMHDMGYDAIYLKPDIDTFAILPWRPQHGKVARFLCDLVDKDGNYIRESPRYILRSVLREAEEKGYTFDLNPSCEFFLFVNDENGNVTTHTGEKAGYLDVAPLDKGENARRDVILTLEEMGFEIQSSWHEMAQGQHAVDFKQARGVRVADQIMTFRTTIRTVAERHGLHATFMPKPRTELPGSAMTFCITAFKDGQNIFNGRDGFYSPEAASFAAGMLEHTKGMSAFANPIINSYKRLNSRSFAPSDIFWSTTDYYAPVRITQNDPDGTCIEWKLPDGAADPYMITALAIKSGISAIETNAEPPAENRKMCALPATLRESVNAFRKDAFLCSVCGENYAHVYADYKMKEWKRYTREVTDWEIREYLQRI